MARPSLFKKKIKPPRKTKDEVGRLTTTFLGPEPVVEGVTFREGFDPAYSAALSWYSQTQEQETFRKFLITYLEVHGRKEDAACVERMKATWIPGTSAAIARLITRGAIIPERSITFMEERLAESMIKGIPTRVVEPEPDGDEDPKPKRKVTDKFPEALADIEAMLKNAIVIDKKPDYYGFLERSFVPVETAGRLADSFIPDRDELSLALTDKTVREGYGKLTFPELRRHAAGYDYLVRELTRYSVRSKPVRQRKSKPIDPVKAVSKMQYKVEDPELGVKSLNPTIILEADELWTFHTRYKTLTVYRARDDSTLGVHRSSVTEYDPERSVSKKAGRRTTEVLKVVTGGNRAALAKLMDGLKGDPKPPAPRINGDTLLLRAWVDTLSKKG